MPSALHLLTTPFLLLFSLPLAAFAAFTTSLAFSTLLIRVSIVYVELGIALVQSAVQAPATTKSPPPARPTAPPRHKRRRSSNFSTASSQDPNATPAGRKPPTKSDSFASLLGAGGPTRDYEGVGGWRYTADGDEDALWMGMNSRLELPAAPSNYSTGRRHDCEYWSGFAPNSDMWVSADVHDDAAVQQDYHARALSGRDVRRNEAPEGGSLRASTLIDLRRDGKRPDKTSRERAKRRRAGPAPPPGASADEIFHDYPSHMYLENMLAVQLKYSDTQIQHAISAAELPAGSSYDRAVPGHRRKLALRARAARNSTIYEEERRKFWNERREKADKGLISWKVRALRTENGLGRKQQPKEGRREKRLEKHLERALQED
ncbi:hypothetical protein B0A49_09963 [Cryomyces minteri]|uniref:Uncharacterized protein n=1 Tax=Cryomyces minteri TaxID=331657 RepID=A0A4U0X0B9_9PEZI|nr:hypothetical protein B0A49_09963 [Cryomyces minteri]